MKLKIYKIFFTILAIALVVVVVLIAFKYINGYQNDKENEKVVEAFMQNLEHTNKSTNIIDENVIDNQNEIQQVTMNGYNVIGVVKIPKIDIEYPILDVETNSPADTEKPMKISIVKYWGRNVNDYGNLSIAGHNNYNGTMFGKTRKLTIGDTVELTDLTGRTIKYEIYDRLVVDPNDISILKTNDETIREVTLITCTNGHKNRLIFKAKEIQELKGEF